MKGISWINFILGVWLFFAPFTLGYRGTTIALYQDLVVGFLIAGFALWRALGSNEKSPLAGVSWIVTILGFWVLISPFALEFRSVSVALWNNVIVGIAVAVLGIFNAYQEPHAMPMHREQH